MAKEVKKYTVSMYTWPIEVIVTAKNEREARKKAYEKVKKQSALKHVRKDQTDVSEMYRSNF